MLVTKGYLVWIAYGRKTNYQKWLSILGQMQRKFFTVDGHFVVEFGEGGAAPLFFALYLSSRNWDAGAWYERDCPQVYFVMRYFIVF